ncbi:MAG TPA: Uma2 family endonuclease [Leptolyngbyaceae cyanobacterium M33_DOE_097]|uniref:Uma2 family endonuclease n=1 Tax=Oscillatoriales cyanobacterium SpSt-418 TaxID=2282169 RepID=A0A7C3KFH0_9CYAN|nr:Uma2 family endonuclease [Leptolyngbyaceae cyanobacterium M33_DOE_097]
MVQARLRFKNFEEYLLVNPEDLPEGPHVYVDGELVAVSPESRVNLLIARYLSKCLEASGVPFELIYCHAFEIEVPVFSQIREQTRYPDLVVIRPEHLELTENRATITVDMPAPQLVAEVVSGGDENRRRDYQAKRKQYEARGIPEYWLIDPEKQQIIVLSLAGDNYAESGVFQGGDRESCAMQLVRNGVNRHF